MQNRNEQGVRMARLKRKTRNANIKMAIIALLFFLALGHIFFNSLQSKEVSSARSMELLEFLKPIFDPDGSFSVEDFHVLVRKLAHFAEFALLGFSIGLMVYYIYKKTEKLFIGTALFLSLAGGVADEFLQNFTERTSSVKDVLIDFAGALCGLVAAAVLVAVVNWLRVKLRKER